jgi:Flp pilus assembly pilin Flp
VGAQRPGTGGRRGVTAEARACGLLSGPRFTQSSGNHGKDPTVNTSNQKTQISPHRGQGMTEYIIIVGLIAIASIGVITLFGDNVRRVFGMSADALSADDSVSQRNTTKANDNITNKTFKNFAQNNTY